MPMADRRAKAGRSMFVPLSKALFFAITPSNFAILVGLIGCLLLFTETAQAFGRVLACAGFLALLAGGLLPAAAWVLLPLEQRFPAFNDDGERVDGIIVLGGALQTVISNARGQLTLNDAGERQIALADLARRYPQAHLVFSGGGLRAGSASEAGIVARFADTLALPRDRLILEERSRNTHENATFTAALVKPNQHQRWLLVTSAWHMPRAVGCFRKAGFSVVAYPVDYRTAGPADAIRLNTFASDGLFAFDLGAKEWIGLVVYRLAGYTREWLPAP